MEGGRARPDLWLTPVRDALPLTKLLRGGITWRRLTSAPFVSVCASALLLGAAACGHSSDDGLPPLAPSSTPAPDSDPYTRLSPQFDPLKGATAEYGELNGGVFQIEMPIAWNGDLVIYFRGARGGAELSVDQPPLRSYLISHGYAWAATSYNTNVHISGASADQSAVLWDYFARRFRKPKHTYAVGDSMGGAGALVAAENYKDRFSGALVSCGVAGVYPTYDLTADLLAVGAYAVGVTQAEFESTPISQLVYQRIEPAVEAPGPIRDRFLSIWIDITGGVRPFDVDGYNLRAKALWGLIVGDLSIGLSDNQTTEYTFSNQSGLDSADFNRKAVRVRAGPQRTIKPDNDPGGDIKVPVIMLHTSGDGIVPLSEFKMNVGRILAHAGGDLFRVHVFDRPGHCEFALLESSQAFADLVQWVEGGVEPTLETRAG